MRRSPTEETDQGQAGSQAGSHAIYPPPSMFRKPPVSALSGGAVGVMGMGETNTSAGVVGGGDCF